MGVSARLSMTGGLNSARPVSIFAKQDRLLNIYPDAEVAYSLDKLDKNYEGSAVRVRRSSDNQEQDIGFVSNLFDSASLETFVNQDYVQIQSDYSGESPSPSAATVDLTLTSNQSIAGVDRALKVTSTINGTPYFYMTNIGGSGVELKISFDYYIPNEQGLNIIRCGVAAGSEQDFSVTGEWASAEFEQTSTQTFLIFRGRNAEIDDVFYIKNLVVTQTSSDAHVTTWYDQSGNAVDATQSTASKQPKIAVQGAYLGYVENITNTSTATLNSSYEYVAGQRFTSFIVGQQFGSAVFGGTNSGNVYYAVSQDGNTQNSRLGFENLSMFGNGNSVADRREDVASLMVNTALLTTLAQRNIGEQSQTLAMGYTTGSFNNARFKEYIIYNNQSVNREEVEAYIMGHYNL